MITCYLKLVVSNHTSNGSKTKTFFSKHLGLPQPVFIPSIHHFHLSLFHSCATSQTNWHGDNSNVVFSIGVPQPKIIYSFHGNENLDFDLLNCDIV
jgi:hypothetical protein